MEQELVLAWLSLHSCLLSGYWAEGHRILRQMKHPCTFAKALLIGRRHA